MSRSYANSVLLLTVSITPTLITSAEEVMFSLFVVCLSVCSIVCLSVNKI